MAKARETACQIGFLYAFTIPLAAYTVMVLLVLFRGELPEARSLPVSQMALLLLPTLGVYAYASYRIYPRFVEPLLISWGWDTDSWWRMIQIVAVGGLSMVFLPLILLLAVLFLFSPAS